MKNTKMILGAAAILIASGAGSAEAHFIFKYKNGWVVNHDSGIRFWCRDLGVMVCTPMASSTAPPSTNSVFREIRNGHRIYDVSGSLPEDVQKVIRADGSNKRQPTREAAMLAAELQRLFPKTDSTGPQRK